MMSENQVLVSRSLALAMTAVAVIMTLAVIRPDRPITPGDMATLCATVAVIWGTKYTADNVIELRLASESARRPFVHVVLREVMNSGERHLVAEIHNLGAIGVVGLSASFREITEWDAPGRWSDLRLTPPFLIPNTHAEADLKVNRWLPDATALELKVEYESLSSGRVVELWRFPVVDFAFQLSGRRVS